MSCIHVFARFYPEIVRLIHPITFISEFQKLDSKVLRYQTGLEESQRREDGLKEELHRKEQEIEQLSKSQTQHGELQLECQAQKFKIQGAYIGVYIGINIQLFLLEEFPVATMYV